MSKTHVHLDDGLNAVETPSRRVAVGTAIEVALILAAILTYIWKWQHSHPRVWIVVLALIFITHFLHHDTLSGLGLGLIGLRSSAEWLLPIAVFLYIPLLIFGIAHYELALLRPRRGHRWSCCWVMEFGVHFSSIWRSRISTIVWR